MCREHFGRLRDLYDTPAQQLWDERTEAESSEYMAMGDLDRVLENSAVGEGAEASVCMHLVVFCCTKVVSLVLLAHASPTLLPACPRHDQTNAGVLARHGVGAMAL